MFDYYNLPSEAEAKAEELFHRMAALAETCNNRADFETKLASSPLNDEYNALFSEFAPYVKPSEGTPTKESQAKQMAAGQARSVAKSQARNRLKGAFINLLPDSVSRWFIYGIHNIPVISKIITARNTAEMISKRKDKHSFDKNDV